MKTEFTMEEMELEIEVLSHTFDVVRLVDPIANLEHKIIDHRFECNNYVCYDVWGRGHKCDYCVSARCKHDGGRHTKFEFVGDDVYTVVAKPVIVEGRELIMEIVSNIGDKLMMEALGENGFIDKITAYNDTVYRDVLTGCYNRRYLDEQLFVLCSRYKVKSLTVVMVDLDDFKYVNDTFGHNTGDKALIGMVKKLLKVCEENDADFVARYGGDEFVMVLTDKTYSKIEEILSQIDTTLEFDNTDYICSFSMGVAYSDSNINVAEDMLALADKNLYMVKNNGKGHYRIEKT